jgi:putative DNA primase/helicase
MLLVRAHMAGTGKSYLVDTAAVIATGRLCPVITALKSVEETEKRLGSIVLSGIPMISLDNCIHDLEGEFLCQIAERPVVKIRILGRSETPDCEIHTAVCATGNNITFKGDMVRRGLMCNLETLDERSELRKFNRDTLRQAATNRGAYVAAALTVMRAYLAAGAPPVCGPFGSYSEWSTMVRSPLVWLGEPDPIASIDATQAEDPELSRSARDGRPLAGRAQARRALQERQHHRGCVYRARRLQCPGVQAVSPAHSRREGWQRFS